MYHRIYSSISAAKSSIVRSCLEHYGAVCQICGFDSSAEYGIPGIIHVHHKEPIADKMTESWNVDPVEDLVPLCPTCHALVHSKKRDPCSYDVFCQP